MRDLLILSGNAHPALAKAIAKELRIKLVDASIDSFPDGETRVQITENVRDKDVFVIQPTGAPANQNIMEALIIIDALKRASAGRITLVMPYYGYSRQDRKDASRVPITAKLAANLFAAAGVDRLLAIDLHAAQIQGFSDLPFDHLYAGQTITAVIKKEIDHPLVIAPDVGAAKMARKFAHKLGTDWAIVDKERIDGRTTEVAAIIGNDIKGRNAVIVDDMATTAGSLLNAAAALKKAGAKSVVAAVTHGILCDGAPKRIDADRNIDHLYTTDTLPPVEESKKITYISIAPLLAQAITNIHKGESVSGLF